MFGGILNFQVNRTIFVKTQLINLAEIKMTGMLNQIVSECIFEVKGKGTASPLMPLDPMSWQLQKQNHVLVAVVIRTYTKSCQMSLQTCKLFA